MFFPTNKNDCYILKLYESWHHPHPVGSVRHSSLYCYFLDVFICIHILFIGLNLLIAVVLFYSDQSLVALPQFLFRTTHIHKSTPLFTLI